MHAIQIWLVRERDTGEQLVLKEIAVRNQAERDEASNEAAVLAAVSHINIVAFVELVQPVRNYPTGISLN